MEKRGVSGVIVGVLLILVVISAVIIVYIFVTQFTSSSSSKGKDSFDCLSEVNLEIVDSCYSVSNGITEVKVSVKNNNGFDYESDFFSVIANGVTVPIPTALDDSGLGGFEQKEFTFYGNFDEGAKFSLIPKIRQNEGYCYGNALKFTPEKAC